MDDFTTSAGSLAVIAAVVRGIPAFFVYRKALAPRLRAALAFLQSTALPLVVVITEIGVSTHNMKPENATALVGAAMLSVLLFPLAGFAFMGKATDDPALAVTAEDTAIADDLDFFDEP